MEEDLVHLGIRRVWGGGEHPFVLSTADRRYHTFILGKTGSGKTSLLRNILIQDIALGHGVAVLDPHGDLADDLLNHIPPSRIKDVVFFNPADAAYPIGFNVLANVNPENRHLVASGVVGAFKAIWGDSWGPRLEYILYAAVAALCECQNVSLLGVQRILADKRYRQWVIRQVKDTAVRNFWAAEFESYDRRFLAEVISPIQNKIGQILIGPLRNTFGQVRSKIDFRFMMDHSRIFIAKISKGLLGADKANLFGSLLVTQFQLAAMSRASGNASSRNRRALRRVRESIVLDSLPTL